MSMRGRLLVSLAGALAAGGGIAVLYYLPPTPDSWYPRCMLHWLTGLHCPGCGFTRAMHAFLNGDFALAFAYNALLLLLLPLIVVLTLHEWAAWVVGRRLTERRLPAWFITCLLVAFLVFGVVRNLPWKPFVRLAPPELPIETLVSHS